METEGRRSRSAAVSGCCPFPAGPLRFRGLFLRVKRSSRCGVRSENSFRTSQDAGGLSFEFCSREPEGSCHRRKDRISGLPAEFRHGRERCHTMRQWRRRLRSNSFSKVFSSCMPHLCPGIVCLFPAGSHARFIPAFRPRRMEPCVPACNGFAPVCFYSSACCFSGMLSSACSAIQRRVHSTAGIPRSAMQLEQKMIPSMIPFLRYLRYRSH